jgi:hypothetical protein|tara:strand:- start:1397 stop:1834 length:438 start_codon:yes stop_codon:yes gene_type:complete
MKSWIDDNETTIDEFLDYFNNELIDAQKEIELSGNLEALAREMPTIICKRLCQLSEIESRLETLNIKLMALRSKIYLPCREQHSPSRVSRDLDRKVDEGKEAHKLLAEIDHVTLIRDKFLMVTEALGLKNLQIGKRIDLITVGIS